MLPYFIAINGYPDAGKSTVQKYLFERYDYFPVDDGRVIRDTAMAWFGWSEEMVNTNAGKAMRVTVLGKDTVVRTELQQIGLYFERRFGDHIVAEATLRHLPQGKARYSFGSVRRTQAAVYKRHGGLVMAIRRPATEAQWQGIEAEQYDPALVDVWLVHGPLPELHRQIDAALARFADAA